MLSGKSPSYMGDPHSPGSAGLSGGDETRLKQYEEIQTYLLDVCPLVPCFYETMSLGVNAKLQNLTPDTSGLHRFYDCYIPLD